MDSAVRDRWIELATRRISAAGLRSGAVRTRVVELLARDGQCLIAVQDVVDRLRAAGAPGSQASVYRVLDELLGLGLLRRVMDEQGVAHYEIADPEVHHHHLVDEATGDVAPFTDAGLEEAILATANRLGIELTGHEVVLRGRRRVPGPPAA
jgi:Fur family transcriptional regulator, ferric uptake regulator